MINISWLDKTSWQFLTTQLLWQYFCLFVCNRRDTIQYHGGLRSRKLGQAPMIQVFLTPRQTLSSEPSQQMVWLYWLQDRDRMPNWYTTNHPTTLHTHTQWNPVTTAARRWHFGMYPAGKVAISQHLATPGFPLVWPYCQQAQCGCWFTVWWSLPFAWITGPATDPNFNYFRNDSIVKSMTSGLSKSICSSA
jgi:hypothetical protein